MNRKERITLANQTLEIIDRGVYGTASGSSVEIKGLLEDCIVGTSLYTPDQLESYLSNPRHCASGRMPLEVCNETTLNGAKRLVQTEGFSRVGVLNFASARNPGGGFLGGSQAQEESLARSSGLYASLRTSTEYYQYHRGRKTGLYSDRMIYSPSCPVFMDDDGALLDEPYLVDFVTSPAPNAGAILNNHPEDAALIPDCFNLRIRKLLALLYERKCDALVLGAWGCGVFRNDPQMVAQLFAHYLGESGEFYGCFKKVVFSVYDPTKSQHIYQAFEGALIHGGDEGGGEG